MRHRVFRALRSLSGALTGIAAIVILGSLFITGMETYDWMRLPTTTATVQSVATKCAMSYKIGKSTGKRTVVDCADVRAVRSKAPDLDWTVKRTEIATILFHPPGGKLVVGDYPLTRLNKTHVEVGEALTISYRPWRPEAIKGPPNAVWLFHMLKLYGLGGAILVGAWVARRLAAWLLTDEERLVVEAIKRARTSFGWGERLTSVAMILPLFFFGRIALYGAVLVMILAGGAYGLMAWSDSATVPATATVTGVHEICTLSYKTGKFSSHEKTVACSDIAAEKARVPEVQWRTAKKTEVSLAFQSVDGVGHTAKKTRRSTSDVPSPGDRIAIRYFPSNPSSILLVNTGLMRSLQWIFGIAAVFFIAGLLLRPLLKGAERWEAADFRERTERELATVIMDKALQDVGFLKPAAAGSPPPRPSATPRGGVARHGFGRRASV